MKLQLEIQFIFCIQMISYLEREKEREKGAGAHLRCYIYEIQLRREGTKICEPEMSRDITTAVWKEATNGFQYINVILRNA